MFMRGDATVEGYMQAMVPCRLSDLSHNALEVATRKGGSTFIRRSDKLVAAMDGVVARLEAERDGRTGVRKEDGPVGVDIHLLFATTDGTRHDKPMTDKPDMDNIAKSLLDCLVRAHWLEDDAQVTTLVVSKTWACREPGSPDVAALGVVNHTWADAER